MLARLARRTLAAADREIPVLLDLLAVATSAGLPPQLAFRRAVEAATGPLADELRSVLDASDLGGRWRDELVVVGDRLALPDLHRLLGALARTDSLGSSLAEEIGHLASDVREVRRAAAAQRARTAPVKMLFPLVFTIVRFVVPPPQGRFQLRVGSRPSPALKTCAPASDDCFFAVAKLDCQPRKRR